MKKYGVSGTLGELNDQEILTKHYHVKIFKVPRNKQRIKPIYIKEKPILMNYFIIFIKK